jgi:hypothetical protein
VRAEIDARIRALRPALEEYEELLDAAETLEDEAAPEQKNEATSARRRGPRGSAAGALALAASGLNKPAAPAKAGAPRKTAAPRKAAAPRKTAAPRKPVASKPPSATRGVAEQAIVAALEHGSHTVSELVLVTAMPAAEIRAAAKKLQRGGVIGPTRREGRIAYALSALVAQD